MAHINRRFIDKHWFVFAVRGAMAGVFGFILLFGGSSDLSSVIALISVFLLCMGIVDSLSALYASAKKHGWVVSVIDAIIDIVAALGLLFIAKGDIVKSLIIISAYTVLPRFNRICPSVDNV